MVGWLSPERLRVWFVAILGYVAGSRAVEEGFASSPPLACLRRHRTLLDAIWTSSSARGWEETGRLLQDFCWSFSFSCEILSPFQYQSHQALEVLAQLIQVLLPALEHAAETLGNHEHGDVGLTGRQDAVGAWLAVREALQMASTAAGGFRVAFRETFLFGMGGFTEDLLIWWDHGVKWAWRYIDGLCSFCVFTA